MGKKKASRSRKLYPILERAINDGNVFVTTRHSGFEMDITGTKLNVGGKIKEIETRRWHYTIAFVDDDLWYNAGNHIIVLASLDENGEAEFRFMDIKNVLTNDLELWLKKEIEQIITMFKLGGYKSRAEKLKEYLNND